METVLEVIRDSISSDGLQLAEPPIPVASPPQGVQEEGLFLEDDDPGWGYHKEQAFDDRGEGAGIEGDLEAEDD